VFRGTKGDRKEGGDVKEKQIKVIVFSPQSVMYLDVLTDLRIRASFSFAEHQTLIVPFVITCAAALECILNDCLIHAFQGTKHLEVQLDGYLSMTLKGKLINVVPAVTSQRFALNQDHKAYQQLVELIRIRNRLLHNRSSVFEEHTATVIDDADSGPMITFPEGVNIGGNTQHDYTCGIPGDVGRFHDALDTFYNKFVAAWEPDDFKANELVIEAEPAKPVTTIVIKDA
jgi:hypothetical protein